MAYLNNDLLGFLGKPFQGMNIFGAKPSATTQLLAKPTSEGGYGLLSQDMLQKAEMQSLGKGLLTTLASYLAQPKNQGYGSALPYLAGSYLQGMSAAQKPFEGLQESALTNLKLDELKLKKQREEDLRQLQGNLYTTEPGQDRKLNVQALQDYIAKYPEQGLKFAEALQGIDKLGMPTTSRVLTKQEVDSGIYGNLDPTGIYQISPTGVISTIQSPTKISYGVEADKEATRYGYSNFEQAPKETKIKILDALALTDKQKAALMGGIPEFGKSGETDIDKQFLVNSAELQRYDSIAKQFSPSYMTWQTQAKAAALALAQKAGTTLTPDQEKLVYEYTQFKTSTLQQLNDYIVKITGAAIGQGEEEQRLKSSVPNIDDSATQFQAKLDLLTKDVKKAQARLYYLKSKGYKNFEQGFKDIKLDDMPQIMAQREKELIEQYGQGKDLEKNPQIKAIIGRKLASEFGLSY